MLNNICILHKLFDHLKLDDTKFVENFQTKKVPLEKERSHTKRDEH